jgi:glycine/D-amino acid oxidase-like deaminating enzyme/nitrite reductase/ring-hydroxylating ferredoxin subunit
MSNTWNTESLWEGTSPGTAYAPLVGRGSVDVCVIGGGITGLTTAYLIARAGLSVAVLEARAIAMGTTGNTTAKVTALHGLTYADLIKTHGEAAARVYADANQTAVRQVEQIATDETIACDMRRLSAYTYAESEEMADQVRAEVDAARTAGLDARPATDVPLPWSVAAAVELPDSLLFHPRKYCLGLASATQRAGGRIFEQSRVTRIETQDDRFVVATELGSAIDARWVVQATLLPINDPGGLFARVTPSRSYAVAARIDDPEPWGMFLSAETPHRSVRPHQLDTGEAYLVIEGDEHRTGEDAEGEGHFGGLEEWARERIGVTDFQYRWSAQDYMPADGIPFVGRLPMSSDRMLVATGFKKWGMSNGTAAAMMLTDLIVGRDNPWIDVFDARRSGIKGGLGEMVKGNVDVARQFVLSRIASVPGVADLGPATGSIVDYEGTRYAVYRNDHGDLHALSARCTHMGCLVAFNSAEKSWDCPCHGSRFDLAGQVIEGPAVRPLEEIETTDS